MARVHWWERTSSEIKKINGNMCSIQSKKPWAWFTYFEFYSVWSTSETQNPSTCSLFLVIVTIIYHLNSKRKWFSAIISREMEKIGLTFYNYSSKTYNLSQSCEETFIPPVVAPQKRQSRSITITIDQFEEALNNYGIIYSC